MSNISRNFTISQLPGYQSYHGDTTRTQHSLKEAPQANADPTVAASSIESIPIKITLENLKTEEQNPIKIADCTSEWNPIIWWNYAMKLTAGEESKEAIKAVVRAFKGPRAAFIAKVGDVKSLEELRKAFMKEIVDEGEECSAKERLTNYAQRLRNLNFEELDALKILADDTGLSETEAIRLFFKHLNTKVTKDSPFPPATWDQLKFMVRKAESSDKDSLGKQETLSLVNVATTAKILKCDYCGRMGHVWKVCRKRMYETMNPKMRPSGQIKAHQQRMFKKPRARVNLASTNSLEESDSYMDEENDKDMKHHSSRKNSSSINEPRFGYTLVDSVINGVSVSAIADSGANSVVLSTELAQRIGLEISKEPMYITIADGSTIKARGIAKDVPIKLGEQTKRFNCLVLDTKSYSVLLGTEALHAFGVILDFERGKLRIKEKTYPMRTKLELRRPIAEVRLAKSSILKPRQEAFVPIRWNKAREGKNDKWSFEPDMRLASNTALFAAHGVYSENSDKYILMINTSEEDKRLEKGTIIGELHDWEELPSHEIQELKFEMPNLNHISNPRLRSAIENLLYKYKELCTKVKPGEMNFGVKHTIVLSDNVPIRQPVRKLAHKEEEFLKPHLEELQKDGFIEPSTSPFAAPIIIVPKKSGGFRLCIDYRRLNEKTLKEQYPIPRIDETFDSIAGSVIFTTLDLQSGYWQVPIDEESKKLTAFITKFGLFQWLVMPFGLTNAPATFQRLMDAILRGLKWECCLVYLDDIIIYSRSITEHLKHLELVLKRLAQYNLKVNLKKCSFAMSKLLYLGHLVSKEGIQPDPAKIEAVTKLKPPKDVSEVRTLIGLFSYYRRFIKNFSHIAEPLVRLTQKGIQFEWGEEQKKAFSTLTSHLIKQPILAYPDFSQPFILQTDASSYAVGAILAQIRDGKERVIAYASQMLNKAQRNYSVTEKEAYAIHWATKYFRPYLLGREFEIQTDHKALEYLASKAPENEKLARWSLGLQDLNFRVTYRRGIQNGNADAMSRMVGMVACTARFRYDGSNLFLGDKRVPPKTEREEILKNFHEALGHPSIEALMKEVSKTYYWSSMNTDIQNLQASCITCAKYQEVLNVRASVPIEIVAPFERLGIDLVGPLPVTKNRNQYIVVCTDYFTHFAITAAIPDKSAERISQFLKRNVCAVFGPPSILQSDQGLEFKNAIVADLCKTHKIKQILSSPYHPQSNGLVEKTNHTLTRKLAKIATENKISWDEALPIATFAYNTTPQRLLGVSPFTAMFGRSPGITDEVNTKVIDIRELHESIRRRVNMYKQRIKEEEIHKKRPDRLGVGDIVLTKNRNAHKLEAKWLGPFYIKEKGTKGAYIIADMVNSQTRQVHYDDLKLYTGREDAFIINFAISE